MTKKRKKLQGFVKKIIRPALPNESEKAEIQIEEADIHLTTINRYVGAKLRNRIARGFVTSG